ncbi:MAG: hypothetical protein ACI9YH_000634 [Colwellia sp.]|jgi:uncharacterized protein (TIGR02466 family)
MPNSNLRPTAQEQLNIALELANKNKIPEALTMFKQIEASGITDANLFKTIGVLSLRINNTEQAITYLNKSLKLNAQQLDVNFTLGQITQNSGRHTCAIKYFDNALKINNQLAPLWICKGISLTETSLLEEAIESFNRALTIDSKELNALLGLASAYKLQKKYPLAEDFLRKAIAFKPDNVRALFNLSANLYDQNRFQEAILQYQALLNIKPDFAEAHENLGLCYLNVQETEKALRQFETGLKFHPYHQTLNKMCSSLRYELNHQDFLGNYKSIPKKKLKLNVYQDFIASLISSNQLEHAEEEIQSFRKLHGNITPLQHLYYSLLAKKNNHQQIIDEIQSNSDTSTNFQLTLGKSYLAVGESQISQKIFERLLSTQNNDQYIWALYSATLRLADPARYEELCDYDNLLLCAELQYPKRHGSLDSFNQALLTSLQDVHCTQNNPLEQSLVGGTQTPGFLFDQPSPIFSELRAALQSTITTLLNSAQQKHDKNHPTWSRWTNNFDFSTAWSVWLNSSGFHKSHIHSKGWYSSAYYVSVPDILGSNPHAGYLKFGDAPISSNKNLTADKYIKPEAGKLALFPSFFWHGTEPFSSDEARISVAFDLLPNTK